MGRKLSLQAVGDLLHAFLLSMVRLALLYPLVKAAGVVLR